MEAYLNSQAARGWELENVNPLGVARFRRAQRADLRYCTDLLSYRRRREGRQAEREYLELCRGAGWELVDRWGSMGLFASLPGSDPVPIQTDPDTEWHNYRRAYRNSLFWAVMSLLPGVLLWVLIILLAGGLGAMGEALLPVFRFAWPRRWGVIAACAALPVLSAVGLWKLGDFLWNRLWGGRERTVHTPGRRALWANGVVNLLGVAALLVLLAGLVADLIQTGGSVGYFVGLAIGGAVAFLHPSLPLGRRSIPGSFASAVPMVGSAYSWGCWWPSPPGATVGTRRASGGAARGLTASTPKSPACRWSGSGTWASPGRRPMP